MRSRQLDLTRYDTDKVRSGYLERYDEVFEPWLDHEFVLLELGVHRGGSLELWRDYFPNATIVGIDVSLPASIEPGDRILAFEGSQADTAFLSRVAEEAAPDGFGIIIDDASHLGELTRIAFWHLFEHHLAAGGIYVIEDWGTGYFDDWPDGRAPRTDRSSAPGQSPSLWRRLGRRAGVGRRFPSHDYGLVGFLKQLVDEQGAYDASSGALEGSPKRSSKFHKMQIVPSMAFIWKPRG